MKRAVLVFTALVVLVVVTSCAAPSETGGDLETRVAQLETQLAEAESAQAATQSPTDLAAPPPTSTDTPMPVPPTNTPPPSPTPTPQARISQRDLRMDDWQIHLVDAYVTPGVGPNRKNVDLILDVTNVGQSTSRFIALSMLLRDAQGRSYEWHQIASWRCTESHDLQIPTSMNPGATRRTCATYDVPLDAQAFSTSPNRLVSIWQGGLAFEVP